VLGYIVKLLTAILTRSLSKHFLKSSLTRPHIFFIFTSELSNECMFHGRKNEYVL